MFEGIGGLNRMRAVPMFYDHHEILGQFVVKIEEGTLIQLREK